MASYNRVVLMGNLTRDIEIRYTPGGMAVTDINIAVNDRRKNQAGEWVEEVNFIDVTLWGRTAEVAGEYLGKGSPIFVEGRLKLDSWESDGKKNYRLKVIGERMQMLPNGSSGGGADHPVRREAAGREPARESVRESHYETEDYHETPGVAQGPTRSPGSRPNSAREAQPTGNGPGYDDGNIPF